MDKALKTIPDALSVLKDHRKNLAEALTQLGRFSALAADSVYQTKEALVASCEISVRRSSAAGQCGPALDRALSFLPTFPFPKETLTNWIRGDYATDAGPRSDAEPHRSGHLHRLAWELRPDVAGASVGPDHRQFPSPCNCRWSRHRGQPAGWPRTDSTRGADMRLTRRILLQMAIFALIATIALTIMVFGYMRLPAFFGVGQYQVTMKARRKRRPVPRAATSPTAASRSARSRASR